MAKTILIDIRRLSGVKDIIVYMTQSGDGDTRRIPVTGVGEKDG